MRGFVGTAEYLSSRKAHLPSNSKIAVTCLLDNRPYKLLGTAYALLKTSNVPI